MNLRLPCVAILIVMGGQVQTNGGVIVGDSVAEFSLTQGENGWFYGYYQDQFTPSNFRLMTTFNASWPAWQVDYRDPPPLYWTYITPTIAHGNGHLVNFDRTPVEQWAVRRWVSDVEGQVTISGTIADRDAGSFDNGAIGRIFVGNAELLTVDIAASDFVGVDYSVLATVSIGTTIDFVVDPKDGNSRFDATRFTSVVSTATVPEPTSLAIFGIGALGMVGIGVRHKRMKA